MNENIIVPDVLNPTSDSGVLLLCDHASNVVPVALNNMGLSAEKLQEHIYCAT